MSSKIKVKIESMDQPPSQEELRQFAREHCKVTCYGDKIRTKQEFKDEVNINTIMAKARAGQIIDPALLAYKGLPQYGDFSNVPDLATANQLVKDAVDDFEKLPVAVRNRFGHDPIKLITFVQDPNNKEDAVRLGIIPNEAKPTSIPAHGEPDLGAGGPPKPEGEANEGV